MAKIEANKEAVSGLRLLLRHTAIQYAVAMSIVIAALFGGLYLIKDSAIMDAFKRDDAALSAIVEGQKGLSVQLDALAVDNNAIHTDIIEVKNDMKELQKMVIISIVFNPNALLINVRRRSRWQRNSKLTTTYAVSTESS